MFQHKNILIFAAHQDDETIGCGASIKKWTDAGSDVEVVFMTDGATGIDHAGDYNENSIVTARQYEAHLAGQVLGIRDIHNLYVECQKVEYSRELFHKVIKIIRDKKPDLVITHSENDKHRDHRNTSQIVREACWKSSETILPELGPTHKTKDLWAFEITDILPEVDFVVDVTDSFEAKLKAMSFYNSQHEIVSGINEYLNGLSKVRGYEIGKDRGEAFKRISAFPMEVL
jgi:LmbE family N-acetylglucosaminyl deacetylase